MMKDFTFNVPQDIIFGKGSLKRLPELLEKMWFQEDASDLRTGFEEDRNGRESRRDREGFRYRSGSIY